MDIRIVSNSLPEWIAAIGTLAAVIVALFGPAAHRWITRPVLEIEYQPGDPFDRRTDGSIDGRTVGPLFWTRVRIKNRGRGTAHACYVKLSTISDTQGRPKTDIDPMTLGWSSTVRDLAHKRLDLAPGDHQFADLFLSSSSEPRAIVPWVPPDAGFLPALDADSQFCVTVSALCDEMHARMHLLVKIASDGSRRISVVDRLP